MALVAIVAGVLGRWVFLCVIVVYGSIAHGADWCVQVNGFGNCSDAASGDSMAREYHLSHYTYSAGHPCFRQESFTLDHNTVYVKQPTGLTDMREIVSLIAWSSASCGCTTPGCRSSLTTRDYTCMRGAVKSSSGNVCVCPSGLTQSADGFSCVSFSCTPPQVMDEYGHSCMTPPTCNPPLVLNAAQNGCVVGIQCTAPQVRDPLTNACVNPPPVACEPPQHRDPATNSCISCAVGRAWDTARGFCAEDTDGDGTSDREDDFPDDPEEQADGDEDGTGDNGDTDPEDPTSGGDSDRDGTPDAEDDFPIDPKASKDSDGDGTPDAEDSSPFDPTQGGDADRDGTPDAEDEEPYNALKGGAGVDEKIEEVLAKADELIENQRAMMDESANTVPAGESFEGPGLESKTIEQSSADYYAQLEEVPLVQAVKNLGSSYAEGPGSCPFAVEFELPSLGATFGFGSACAIYDSVSPLLSVVALACWGLVGIRIVMSA